MRNIVIAGLTYEDNLGDVLLGRCIKYLVNECINSLGCDDIDVRLLDLRGRRGLHMKPEHTIVDRVQRKLSKKLNWCFDIKRMPTSLIREKIDKETCMVIIWGAVLDCDNKEGGAYFIPSCQCVNRCKNFDIPVIFACIPARTDLSENDISIVCQLFNNKCVKAIGVRENKDYFRELYLHNNKIDLYDVADAAWITNEIIRIQPSKEKRIGICIAHSKLMINHNGMTEEQQIEWWIMIIKTVVCSGYEVLLFSNGYKLDYEFANTVYINFINKYGNNGIELGKNPSEVEEFVSIIARCSGIITERMHPGIVSYSFGIPFLMLVWNEKQMEFCKKISAEELCVEMNREKPNEIVSRMINMIERGYDFNKNSTGKYVRELKNLFYNSIKEYVNVKQ